MTSLLFVIRLHMHFDPFTVFVGNDVGAT